MVTIKSIMIIIVQSPKWSPTNRLRHGDRVGEVLHDDDDELPDEDAERRDEQRHPDDAHRPRARRACSTCHNYVYHSHSTITSLIAPTDLWQAVRARPAGEVFHQAQRGSHFDV